MRKDNVKINADKCVECLCCQLICSLTYLGKFIPEKAFIKIDPRIDNHDQVKIGFDDDCVKECTLCTRYCEFGAIVKSNLKESHIT